MTIPWLYDRLAFGWAGLIVEVGRGCSATCRELAGLVGLVVAWVPLTWILAQIINISPVAGGQKMPYSGVLGGLPPSGCYFRLWGVALGGLPLVGVIGLVFLGGWCLFGYMFDRFCIVSRVAYR